MSEEQGAEAEDLYQMYGFISDKDTCGMEFSCWKTALRLIDNLESFMTIDAISSPGCEQCFCVIGLV